MRLRQLSDLIDLNLSHVAFILIYGNDASLRSFVQEMICQRGKETGVQISFAPTLGEIHTHGASLFDAPTAHHLHVIAKIGEKDFSKAQDLLKAPNTKQTLLAMGETLTTKGKCVTTSLEHPEYLAIPCYEAKPAEFQNLLTHILAKRQMRLDPPLFKELLGFMIDCPGRFFKEVDKIQLYLTSQQPLTSEILRDLLGATDVFNLDGLIQSILLKNPKDVATQVPLQFIEDEFYLIVRSLGKILMQLTEILSYTAQGLSFAQAQSQLSTPIFFKVKPLLETATGKWQRTEVAKALMTLWDLEKRFKNQEISPINTMAVFKSLAS